MIRRSNFVLGIGCSAVLHGVLLAMLLGGNGTAPPPPPSTPPAAPIQIASVDPQEKLPLDPLPTESPQPPESLDPVPTDPAPAPSPDDARAKRPAPAEPRPPLPVTERVAAPVAPPNRAEPSAASDPPLRDPVPATSPGRRPGDPEPVPPLRVHWSSAGELVDVARTLGMRLAAVDRRGNIIAEVDLSETPGLKRWRGLPYGYSNRVRMLSPSIFSSPLGQLDGAQIEEIWVFVPSDRDRAMVEAQRDAARRVGAEPQEVLYMDGRFVPAANGSFRLDVTNVRRRSRGRIGDG